VERLSKKSTWFTGYPPYWCDADVPDPQRIAVD
jgi:hypothetical protein